MMVMLGLMCGLSIFKKILCVNVGNIKVMMLILCVVFFGFFVMRVGLDLIMWGFWLCWWYVIFRLVVFIILFYCLVLFWYKLSICILVFGLDEVIFVNVWVLLLLL